jgi:hypothetical protein
VGQQASKQSFAPAPDEVVFHTKWPLKVPLYVFVAIALVAAVVIGVAPPLRNMLGVGLWVAWLVGGIALALGAETYRHSCMLLQWVALSKRGIRWFENGQLHERPWSDFARVQQHVTEYYYNGIYSGDLHMSVVQFHSGEALALSPYHIPDYEKLIAAIENGSRNNFSAAYAGAVCAADQPADRCGW